MATQSLRDGDAIIKAMEAHLPDEQARLLDPVKVAEFVELVECVDGALPDDGTVRPDLDQADGVATVTFRAVGVTTPVAVVAFDVTRIEVAVRTPTGELDPVTLHTENHPVEPIENLEGVKDEIRERIDKTMFG